MQREKCILMDVAIPEDWNAKQNEAENKQKYKSLGIDIQRLSNIK
jgi:hypothetical protein